MKEIGQHQCCGQFLVFPGLTTSAFKYFYFSVFRELNVFIFGHAGSSLLLGFSLAVESQLSSCHAGAAHHGGFFCCRALALGLLGFSGCGSRFLEHRSIIVEHGLSCSKAVGSSQTRDQTCVSCIGRWILYHWATRKALDFQLQVWMYSGDYLSDLY